MANKSQYRFSIKGCGIIIAFDSEGYIVEAKGFGRLIWISNLNIDKELIGKHVDELAEMLKKDGIDNAYLNFEAGVHVKLLKEMLKNATN